MNFVGLLVHRLPNNMVTVLDELTAPLYSHISQLISMDIETADDKLARLDIKKAYLSLLNGILQSGLEGVFTSERESSSVCSHLK
jgi:exportin-T